VAAGRFERGRNGGVRRGHVWTGKHFTGSLPENHPLRGFDAAEIIWDLLKAHVPGKERVPSEALQ
jgi:hypothetical protein